jgi:hypothetical protein
MQGNANRKTRSAVVLAGLDLMATVAFSRAATDIADL